MKDGTSGLKEARELPVDLIEKLFCKLVEYATVNSNDRGTFRNGVKNQHKDRKVAGVRFAPDAGRFFCS